MNPRLSICIPTFNRKSYLQVTIESIISQVDTFEAGLIEICISDNASTDGTEDFIAELQQVSPIRIIYSRNITNLGADANYMRVVELALGDYCWFMGSDDAAVKGSVVALLDEIELGYDIFLCNRIECDINMNQIKKRYWLDECASSHVYDFSDPNQFSNYTNQARSVGALFSYLSSIVFKRSKWAAISLDEDFIGTAYSHVYMLLSFIKTGCDLKYVQEHLVLSRGGNDSFLLTGDGGLVKRIMIDIDGYTLVAKKVFAQQKSYYRDLLHVLRVERPALHTLKYLRLCADEKTWRKIAKSCREAGYSQILLGLFWMFKPALVFVEKLRHRV